MRKVCIFYRKAYYKFLSWFCCTGMGKLPPQKYLLTPTPTELPWRVAVCLSASRTTVAPSPAGHEVLLCLSAESWRDCKCPPQLTWIFLFTNASRELNPDSIALELHRQESATFLPFSIGNPTVNSGVTPSGAGAQSGLPLAFHGRGNCREARWERPCAVGGGASGLERVRTCERASRSGFWGSRRR